MQLQRFINFGPVLCPEAKEPDPRVLGRWNAFSSATRDAIKIAAAVSVLWAVIEGAQIGTHLFAWIAANPDTGAASAILVSVLVSVGIALFAVRRLEEVRCAASARKKAEAHAFRLAYQDSLTGLPNRQALNDALAAAMQRDGLGNPVHLLVIDLDRFKHVNDAHGHLAGDLVLRSAARRITSVLKCGQRAYRLGGDEFAVLLEAAGPSGDAEAERIARAINAAVEAPFEADGLVHYIGASIGIAAWPRDARNPEALMRCADVALYRVKDSGRGDARVYEPSMGEAIARRSTLERMMRVSVRKQEFEPFYQPLIDLTSRRIIGFELLARWRHPDLPGVGPDQFIPVAEESGLINDLFLSLLERAFRETRGWDQSLRMSVNISPVQLRDPQLAQKLLAVMLRNGFSPSRLDVEITENAIISNPETANSILTSLKNQGASISLDDFGTGYSSLHHLRTLPLDKIKIDRSFILSITDEVESQKIVRAIAGLAASLDLPVVAEGIESDEAAARVLELGCTYGQGYLFGRPMPAADMVARLASPLALTA